MASSPSSLYLFAGDSLTEGQYGEDYVERVGKALYHGQLGLAGDVVNAGLSGDTVGSLLARIDEPLQAYRPDWLILAVGTNDVWIPWLANHSVGWLAWTQVQRLTKRRKPATDLDQFAALYRALIDKGQQAGARVLVCTTTPIGERVSSPLNRQIARMNGVIKHVAVHLQVPVADVWQAFVEELAPREKPSGRVPGEWLFNWVDRARLRRSAPDKMARRRRLHLTFDGLHLNSRGADLWAQTIVHALARAQESEIEPEPSLSLLDVPLLTDGRD